MVDHAVAAHGHDGVVSTFGRGRNFLSGLARVERPCRFHAVVLVQDGHHVAKQTAGETGGRGIGDEEELGHEDGGYRPAE